MPPNRRTRAPLPRSAAGRRPALCACAALILALILSRPARGATDPPDPQTDAGLALVPKAITAAVQRILPCVVTIETFGGATGRPGPTAPGAPGLPLAPGGPVSRLGITGLSRPGEGPSTGLILTPDGLIVTSTYNFLRRPEVITVVLHDGSEHVARMLGRDDTRKITLLKIDGVSGLPVPRFLAPATLRVGQWAVAVGMGYGSDQPAVSAGIVSATSRISRHAVQTDAKISPANYGGPLIDLEGQVIGICVPLSPMGQSVDAGVEWYDSGIGFAIPLAGAQAWLDQLAAGKTILPGKMGVVVGPGQLPGAVLGAAGEPGGVSVLKVLDKSPAFAAGVKVGDRIIAINQDRIRDFMDLKAVMGRYAAGDDIVLSIVRSNANPQLKLHLDSGADQLPQPNPIQFHPPAPGGRG